MLNNVKFAKFLYLKTLIDTNEKELPLTGRRIKDIFKDSKLTNFEKLILALVKFYPEFKRQRELCLEAGISDSELSAWIHGRRGKGYERFFEKYVERDVKSRLRLKVNPDLMDIIIEISKKDQRVNELFEKSRYFNHLVKKDLGLLMHYVKKRVIKLEEAKEIFLEMLERHGIDKEQLVKALNNIPNKALSCYIKEYLRLISHFPISIPIDIKEIVKELRGEESTLKFYGLSFKEIGNIITLCFWDAIRNTWFGKMKRLLIPFPPIIHIFPSCNSEEADELVKYIAKIDDKFRTFGVDIFDNYLLTVIGKPFKIRKWIRVGCFYILLEFDLDVDALINSGEIKIRNAEVRDLNGNLLSGLICPVDGEKCNIKIPIDQSNCPKYKKIIDKLAKDLNEEVNDK